jgi:hypothetical protein
MKKYYIFKDNEERNILYTTKTGKANWIGYILRRKCLLKHVIEGKVGGKDRSDGKMRMKTGTGTG